MHHSDGPEWKNWNAAGLTQLVRTQLGSWYWEVQSRLFPSVLFGCRTDQYGDFFKIKISRTAEEPKYWRSSLKILKFKSLICLNVTWSVREKTSHSVETTEQCWSAASLVPACHQHSFGRCWADARDVCYCSWWTNRQSVFSIFYWV